MTDLRTVLMWLDEQDISPDAEVWILSDGQVLPVTGFQVEEDAWVTSSSIWTAPPPVPLRFASIRDTLMESYSAGGTLKWRTHVSYTYRGSYAVNPDSTVFLVFLPERIQLHETHSERLEKRKEQARQLTQEIETSWQH